MKKLIISLLAAAAFVGGAAMAEAPLSQASLDQVTAGTSLPTVGGAQVYHINFTSYIVNVPYIKDNTAGAGATADALGKNTLTDAKTQTVAVAGYGSSSAAGSLSVASNGYRRW